MIPYPAGSWQERALGDGAEHAGRIGLYGFAEGPCPAATATAPGGAFGSRQPVRQHEPQDQRLGQRRHGALLPQSNASGDANHAPATREVTDYIVGFYNSVRLHSTLG